MQAHAIHTQSFVWNGWLSQGEATSFRPNMFQVHGEDGFSVDYGTRRDDGGGTSWVCFCTIFAGEAISTYTGAHLSTGGVWTNNSDSARKTQVEPVDTQAILDKVARLPLSTWQYTAEDATVRHIGPMAQDFHAAFSVGANETSIATIDADGVALAAIQGLHQLVQEKDARIAELRREMAGMHDELAALKEAVGTLVNRTNPTKGSQ